MSSGPTFEERLAEHDEIMGGLPGNPVLQQQGASLVIQVPGEPVGKGRPRFGHGRVYTPAKTRTWEKAAQYCARQAMTSTPEWTPKTTSPVLVEIMAEFHVPTSWPMQKRADHAGVAHVTTPDLDNICKAVLDALNGLVFHDDAQITSLSASKIYSRTPGVTVVIHEC